MDPQEARRRARETATDWWGKLVIPHDERDLYGVRPLHWDPTVIRKAISRAIRSAVAVRRP